MATTNTHALVIYDTETTPEVVTIAGSLFTDLGFPVGDRLMGAPSPVNIST